MKRKNDGIIILEKVNEYSKDINVQELFLNTAQGRPDRFILDEIQTKETASGLLKIWNCGHNGGITTIYANSSIEGLTILEQYLLEESRMPKEYISLLIIDTVNIVIYIENDHIEINKIVDYNKEYILKKIT